MMSLDTISNTHCMDHQYIVSLSDTVKTTSEDVKLIKESLLGTLNEEGWLSKIRTLETDMENLKKLRGQVTAYTVTAVTSMVAFLVMFFIDKIKF